MLRRFSALTPNVFNIIVYVPSPTMNDFLRRKLKDMFGIGGDFILSVDTVKSLNAAKLDSLVAPLEGDKWLIHVDADKLSRKDLATSIRKNTPHGITVYWTTKYMIYRALSDLDEVSKHPAYNPVFSFSRLGYTAIKILHEEMIPDEKKHLDSDLLHFVAKSYQYDVQAVCELFVMLRSGAEITSRKDIIEAVGVGGNSVGSLTVSLLRSKSRRSFNRILRLINDLTVKYNHRTIRQYMLNTLEAFIDIKQLQIMGIYGRPGKEIPDSYDSKRISRNRRFEQFVLTEISLPKLLTLKLALLEYDHFDSEISLIQAISKYFNTVARSK